MRRRVRLLALALPLAMAACGSDSAADRAAPPTTSSTVTTVATTVANGATPATTAASPSSANATSTTAGGAGPVVNTWVGPAADLTKLPIGTTKVSTAQAVVGGLFVCAAGNPNGGGAFAAGPWIDQAAGTWDATKKVAVQGEVAWPMARYSEHVEGGQRSIASNGIPVGNVTGTFPIAADDPAFAYDRNPNRIGETEVAITLPVAPAVSSTPTCLPKGAVGVFKNGVVAFASVDALNRDAVAYETQDGCDGHPERRSNYHYHDVPSCLRNATVGASTVVGFARDGFPIVVERDAAGTLPTNADLDECHGHSSPILLDGQVVTMYHYAATAEFPYFIGCYRGAPVS